MAIFDNMRYNIPYKGATLVFRQKYVYLDGAIVEMKAWAVPMSARTPEGIKYSLAYIDEHGNRLFGYDNAEGKGHHRHDKKKESPVAFESFGVLLGRFLREIESIRGKRP